MKVLTVVGARPQFIKCAVVSRELRKKATEILVHTGQHYDDNMSDVFFRELDIPKPDHNLGVGSGPHGRQTGEMLSRIEEVLVKERPDTVVVYGDTNSTLAGALAGSKLGIPVAHVEAGLRSFNRRMPEEINRLIADHLSSLLLCPTGTAVANLAREGITAGVHLVGDVMRDALLQNVDRAKGRSDTLAKAGIEPKGFALVTVHRAENTDDGGRLGQIVRALEEIGASLPVIWPVHPRAARSLKSAGIDLGKFPGIRSVAAVSYLDMIRLERDARLILTDSGGVQKESYWLGVPCVVLRDETEWVELTESGWVALAGSASERIVETTARVLSLAPKHGTDILGTEGASERVVGLLLGAVARG